MKKFFQNAEEHRNFNLVTEKLSEVYDCCTEKGFDQACDNCAFSEECTARELWAVCLPWELYQGEDC